MSVGKFCANLFLLSAISFGAHFAHSSLSIFGVFLIEDNLISAAGLGILFSSNYVSAIFLPLLVGYLIDSTKRVKTISLMLLTITALGQAMFVAALYHNSFVLALVAQVIFGSGASSVYAIQRISIAHYLRGNETLTTSVYVAFGGIAKLLGKAITAPLAFELHSYKRALAVPAVLCAASLVCYLVFLALNRSEQPPLPEYSVVGTEDEEQHVEMVMLPGGGVGGLLRPLSWHPYSGDGSAIWQRLSEVAPLQRSYSTGAMDYGALGPVVSPVLAGRVESNAAVAESMKTSMQTQTRDACADLRDEEHNTASLFAAQKQTEVDSGEKVGRSEGNGSGSPRGSALGSRHSHENVGLVALLRRLSARFYLFAALHMAYVLAFHVLFKFIPHFVTVEWGLAIVDAGYVAAFPSVLTMLLAPPTGILLNRYGHSLFVGSLVAVVTCIAYVVLIFVPGLGPILPIVLLSVASATMPTIVLANIVTNLDPGYMGVAFGIVEVLDSLASLVGSSLFGLLYTATGTYTAGLVALALCSLVGLLLMLVAFAEDRRQKQGDSARNSGIVCMGSSGGDGTNVEASSRSRSHSASTLGSVGSIRTLRL